MSHAQDSKSDLEILSAALDGEYFGIAAYQAAVGTGLLDDGVRAVAEKFQADHKQHAVRIREAITARGGAPVEPKSWDRYAADFPPPPLETQADILRYAAFLEQSGARATVGTIGDLSSPELIRLMASIAGVEAMHWSALLGALGENPVPVRFIPLPDSDAAQVEADQRMAG